MPTSPPSDDEVRRINLIEILQEDAKAEGIDIPPPPAHASKQWSEEDIKRYFSSKGKHIPVPVMQRPTDEEFNLWFPGLKRSGTRVDDGKPSLRIVCFPNAGNAEDMYTSEGTGVRKVTSPLLSWCKENKAECLAPQYPGRGMRMKERRITTAQAMAEALFPVLAPSLSDPSIPWVLVAHSVGTWISYEFLMLCKERGVPLPQVAFLSAMASPDIPFKDRPWRQQKSLDEQQFKEECREWDISDVVFSEAMWPMYQPLLRDDFTLFDEYQFHSDTTSLDMPIYAFWGSKDRRIKEHHVMGWAAFTSRTFQIDMIDGNHLWPLDKESKTVWLQKIATILSDRQNE